MQSNNGVNSPAILCEIRVSSTGKTVQGVPAPAWTEIWRVPLRMHEELPISETLLRLPYRHYPPREICVFRRTEGGLTFGLLDESYSASLGGRSARAHVCGVGDRIRFSEDIEFEILRAPPVPGRPAPKVETPRETAAKPLIPIPSVSLAVPSLGDDFGRRPAAAVRAELYRTTRETPKRAAPVRRARLRGYAIALAAIGLVIGFLKARG